MKKFKYITAESSLCDDLDTLDRLYSVFSRAEVYRKSSLEKAERDIYRCRDEILKKWEGK